MNMPDTGTAVTAGWKWWMGELRGCVPRRLRTLMAPSTLRLDISAGNIMLRHSTFPLPLSAADREILVRHLRRRHTAVVFDAGRALVCPVELPLAAERAILAALRFEVDRRTPFKAGSVHLGYRIRERDASGRKLKLDLVCVPKRLLDPVREVLTAAGATLDGITVDLRPERIDLSLDDGPRESAGQAAGRLGHAATLAWALGLGMAVAGLLLPLFRLEATADGLEAEVANLRREAAQGVELERRLTEIANRESALDAFLSGTAPVVLLAELARVAGDDTHFTAFRFDGGTINVDGRGASAAALAEVIEGSPLFRNPTFRAAVTPASGGGEQFSLGFEVESNTPPIARSPDQNSSLSLPQSQAQSRRPQLEHRPFRRSEAR